MLSEKMQELVRGSSVIRAMFEEGKRLATIHGAENVYDFSLGNPNVPAPESIKDAIYDTLNSHEPTAVHGYMNNSGFEDVRATIANHLNKENNLSLTNEHIVMTCGAAGGLNVLFKTLLNPGDEVIVFAPFFSEYRNYVSNYEGKLIIVPSNMETFEPDLEAFEKAITPQTKAVIINTPNNPTGVIYSEETLKALATILLAKESAYGTAIYLISDEPYRELVYDDVKVPCLLHYYPRTFIGYSYSKSLSLPGERIGYLVIHPEMEQLESIQAGLNVATRILGFVNAPALFQKVIAKCIDSTVDVSFYKRNRDLLYNHLTSLGIECIKPSGAFYLFPKSPLADDIAFCNLAKSFNILMVPGSSFGCPGYIRLAYCTSYEMIERSLPAFTQLIQHLKHAKQ